MNYEREADSLSATGTKLEVVMMSPQKVIKLNEKKLKDKKEIDRQSDTRLGMLGS